MARIEELAGNTITLNTVFIVSRMQEATCQKQNQNETVSDVASRFEWHILVRSQKFQKLS